MRGLDALAARDDARRMYKEYLRRIDAEAVLEHYGPQNMHRQGDELIHSCLLDRVDAHHANGDANPSASMNVDKKSYNCYSYGGGNVLWFIMKMEGKEEFHEIVPLLSEFLTGSTVDTSSFLDELEKYLAAKPAAESIPTYNERILKRWAKYHPYLRSRGITKDTAETFQLGYDEEHARITIPHWVNGKLVGWQRRALADERWPMTQVEHAPDGTPLDGGRIPKYKNSPGFPKDSTLYNLDRASMDASGAVTVVESPMSVAKAHSCGINNVVATFGAKINPPQIDLLKSFHQVAVWFDDDDAGRSGAYKLMDNLYRFTTVHHVIPEEGKDMADYDREGMIERLGAPHVEPAVLALARMEKKYGKRR